jgi:hypothetical protein
MVCCFQLIYPGRGYHQPATDIVQLYFENLFVKLFQFYLEKSFCQVVPILSWNLLVKLFEFYLDNLLVKLFQILSSESPCWVVPILFWKSSCQVVRFRKKVKTSDGDFFNQWFVKSSQHTARGSGTRCLAESTPQETRPGSSPNSTSPSPEEGTGRTQRRTWRDHRWSRPRRSPSSWSQSGRLSSWAFPRRPKDLKATKRRLKYNEYGNNDLSMPSTEQKTECWPWTMDTQM